MTSDAPSADFTTVNISDDVESVEVLSLESQISLTYHQVVKKEITVYLRDRAHLVERLCSLKRKQNVIQCVHGAQSMKSVVPEEKAPMAVRLSVKQQSISCEKKCYPQQSDASEPLQLRGIRRQNFQPKNMKSALQPLGDPHSQIAPLPSQTIFQKPLKRLDISLNNTLRGAPPSSRKPMNLSKTDNSRTTPVPSGHSTKPVQYQSLNHLQGIGPLKLVIKEDTTFNMVNKKGSDCRMNCGLMVMWNE